MGIPFYFRHLLQRNRDAVLHKFPGCSRLYLDFNCVVHQCAATVASAAPSSSLSGDQLQARVIDACIQQVVKLVSVAKPSDLVYIAVDGVCPYSKMIQQRNRRYMSMWRAKRLKAASVPGGWTSNCVTPGTEFMAALDAALRGCDWGSKFGPLSVGAVIVSGSDEAGEGEHKIFQHISSSPGAKKGDVVYGLDADLILRSIISKNADDIVLMREKAVFRAAVPCVKDTGAAEYMALSIGGLRTAIHTDAVDAYGTDLDKDSFLTDYAMLMTFIGNDFLPGLSYLKIKEGGIRQLVNAYMAVAESIGMRLVQQPSGGVNIIFVHTLLQMLSAHEHAGLLDSASAYLERRAPPPTGVEADDLEAYPLQPRHKVPLCLPAASSDWRAAYYAQLLRIHKSGPGLEQQVQRLCAEYVRGLHWVHRYYWEHVSDHDWAYVHAYSPTITDLAAYTATHMALQQTAEDDGRRGGRAPTRIDRGLQLLLVLPPCDAGLLPAPLRPIMTDITRGCLHYYPHDFELDTCLRTHLWECRARLPAFDLAHISSVYRECLRGSSSGNTLPEVSHRSPQLLL